MAACGISPGYGDIDRTDPSTQVESLLKFASAMISQLNKLNRQHFQDMKLRVGICNGSIVAGVVGKHGSLIND